MQHKPPPQTESPAGAPQPHPTNFPRRILVVDDDSSARQLCLDVLTGAGYDVEGAEDGAAGWDALQARSFDLVITDNKMPRITGIEMIAKLRSARWATPVIMATGALPTREFARKPWLQPDATLARPFSNVDLLAAVNGLLRVNDGSVGRNEPRMGRTLGASELSYRRLFEAAKDGILILDADTGRINDVNPFLINLLGFSHSEMVGKTVGELSPFKDVLSNQAMLERLQQFGYVRYEDLPLETSDGRVIGGGEDEDFVNAKRRDALISQKVRTLVKKFGRLFPDQPLEVAYAWAGTFGETKDELAYIGVHPRFPHAYFALGYGGNGITFSLIAAEIIRDGFLGKRNRDALIFRFGR